MELSSKESKNRTHEPQRVYKHSNTLKFPCFLFYNKKVFFQVDNKKRITLSVLIYSSLR